MTRKRIKKKKENRPTMPTVETETKERSCVGCLQQEDCHPDGVNFDSRTMASTCSDWNETHEDIPTIEMANVVSGRNTILIQQDLYDRCRKEIGMSDAMIASYSTAEALLQAANGMHPKSNVDARVKEGVPPEPVKFEENMPDTYTLESILEAKFIKTNRDHFDRGNLQACLRRINRRYGPQEPVRIVRDRSFVVVKRELVTKYTIYFKE